MLPEEDISDIVGPALDAPAAPFPWVSVLVPSILVLLGGGAIGGVVVWANRGLGGLEPSSATYERMCRWAGFVGLPPEENSTPFEYADDLADTMPDQRGEIATIANLYVRERFGRHRPFPGEVVEVEQAWRGLRWPLLARLLQRVRRREKPRPEEAEE